MFVCSRVQYIGTLSRHVDQERMQAQRGAGQAIAITEMPSLTLSIGGASSPGLMTRSFEQWDIGTGAAVERHTSLAMDIRYDQAGHPRKRDRVDWGDLFFALHDYNYTIWAC